MNVINYHYNYYNKEILNSNYITVAEKIEINYIQLLQPITTATALSDSAFSTITIVAKAIVTIVDSFTIVPLPIIDLLI